MPATLLRASLRNLLRHKLQSAIAVASLAIGLMVFGFAFLYLKQELSYDRGWPEGERVHRLLLEERGIPGRPDMVHSNVPAVVWPLLADYFSADIDAITRSTSYGVSLIDANSFTGIHFVDASFLDVFQFEVVDGDMRRALSGPGFVAMEEQTAAALGMRGRIGEHVRFEGFNKGQVEYELAAIYRLPRPVSVATDVVMLTLLHDYSRPLFMRNGKPGRAFWDEFTDVWMKLAPGVSAEKINEKLPSFIEQQVRIYDAALGPGRDIADHLAFHLQPVKSVYFNPNTRELGPDAGDPLRVAAFAFVGLLVLLAGCSNSVSLSLAAAIERHHEIGVRKAVGALPGDIMKEQLSEAVLKTMLALMPALAAMEILAPALKALLPVVDVTPSWSDRSLLAAIALAVGMTCGIYPALVLARTRPQMVLRADAQPTLASRSYLRTTLVAGQFCFASILLIVTVALYAQLALARQQPLGFDPDNVLLIERYESDEPLEPLRAELDKLPGVIETSFGASMPPNRNDLPPNFSSISVVLDLNDTQDIKAQNMIAAISFIDFMRMQVIAGRSFDVALDGQPPTAVDGPIPRRIVINVAMARELGFTPEQAAGSRIHQRAIDRSGEVVTRPLDIVGVVEDNQYISLRRRPGPVIYMAEPYRSILLVRYDDAMEDSIAQTIQEISQRVHGLPVRAMDFIEPQIEATFRAERNEGKLLLVCAGLALVLASIGLYGLAAFALERQVKEVGVRKVMGAEVAEIVRLYLWRFSRPVIVANLVAWPLALFLVQQWLQRFPYQMEQTWLLPICIAALGAVLVIAMLTVSVITTRAASVNPVRSLRYE